MLYTINTVTSITANRLIPPLNPFLFIKNKWLFISSEGFSTLWKKCPDILSEGNAALTVGCDSPLQIVMAVWRPFCLNLNFLGRVWQPLLTIMVRKRPLLSANSCHNRPDHSADLFAEGRSAIKAIKALWGLISRPILDLGFLKMPMKTQDTGRQL